MTQEERDKLTADITADLTDIANGGEGSRVCKPLEAKTAKVVRVEPVKVRGRGYRRIQVDTSAYQASHGKRPRGHGLWLFSANDRDVTVEVTGLYSEAKAALMDGSWSLLP